MTMKFKKFKKVMLLGTIIGTVALSGCGKNKEVTEEQVKEWAEANNYVLEDATEETEENTEDLSSDESINYSTEEVEQIAKKSYTENKSLYDYYNASEEDIVTMINVINDNTEGLSREQINDAVGLMQFISHSDNLLQLLDNVNAEKLGFAAYDTQMDVYPNAKLSEFILNKDSNVIETIENYENLRDSLVDEIVETGTYSEETTKKINEALIQQEKDYNEFNGNMDSDSVTQGTEYVIAVTKDSLCQLTQMVNPTTYYIEDENGEKYQLTARTDYNEEGYVESDILAIELQMEMNGQELDAETAQKVAEIQMKLISTKYQNDMCTLQNQILINAGYEGLNLSENSKKLVYNM